MPKKLKDLTVTKVDFVDAGDNKRADVVLFKRDGGQPAPAPTSEATDGAVKEGAFKRFMAHIAKFAGMTDEQIEETMEAVEKDATTFDEKLQQRQRRKAADEIWDYCWMLNDSLCSIFWDENIPEADKGGKMQTSLDEFVTAVTAAIPKWVEGTPTQIAKEATITPERLEFAKRTRTRLDELIAKATTPGEEPGAQNPTNNPTKEEPEDMKIDKSKLTAEELAALDAIEKKAGIPEETGAPAAAPAPAPAAEPAAKAAPAAAPAEGEGEDDIYKGLHPAIAAELKALRKRADEAEDRELLEIAKKYEIIGKKAEELAPTLKSLKAAGNGAYEGMIAVLDASVAAVEKSGVFSEIGKAGIGATGTGDAWAQIEKHAEAIQKAAPNMTWPAAIEKACEQHPDLVHDYEEGR